MNLLVVQPNARVGGHLLPFEHVGNSADQVHLQGQVVPVVSLYLQLEHLEGVLMDTIFVFKLRIYKTYRYFLASNLELKQGQGNQCRTPGVIFEE